MECGAAGRKESDSRFRGNDAVEAKSGASASGLLFEVHAGRAGDGIEGSVDHAGGVFFEEGAGDVDIFGDDDAGRDVTAAQEFERSGAKDGAER